MGYISGLLHDLGKFSKKSQDRVNGKGPKVDHATAGAQEAQKCFNSFLSKIIAYVVSGHHTGIPDYGSENKPRSLVKRLNKSIEDYSGFKEEITIPKDIKKPFNLSKSENPDFSVFFFIKMLFSCLVDADFLDTEKFMNKKKFEQRSQYDENEKLEKLFFDHMDTLLKKAEKTTINQYRAEIYERCLQTANNPTGMFSLTVPTGGGKTLSSMAFALKHAKINDLKRIIYVIPYMSIIEQNAQEYRNIFSDKNILEHHSNFTFKEEDLLETSYRLKLASENWDMPVIATTNVQFFESIFSNRTSRSRKLHNLSKSVIILDEAQMIPVEYLEVCVNALNEIVNHYHSSVVLCTATQPNLQKTGFIPKSIEIKEIIDQPAKLYEAFRRTTIKNIGEMKDEELVCEITKQDQVLCIVNRRKHAEVLYKAIKNGDHTYHLSTRMCSIHRKQTIKTIKDHLKNKEPCQVISTQLIEAGVDIDFPVVYRAMAGLDSIIQAAGRCNREGKKEMAEVFVFSPIEKHAQPPKEIKMNVSQAESIFRNSKDYKDPMSIDAINKYYKLLYHSKNTDTKKIGKKINKSKGTVEYPISEISEKFKIIEDVTIPVIVPFDDYALKLIDELKFSEYPFSTIRKLQPYIVSLYENEFRQLYSNGGIKSIGSEDIFYYLSDKTVFYDDSTGIIIQHDDLLNDCFIC